jgi:enoyl-CoA hydratase
VIHEPEGESVSDEQPSLSYEREGPIVILTMNRPDRRNALSMDMIVRFADAWQEIEADDAIRAVILTGAAGAYCVGGDLSTGWMAGNRDYEPTPHEKRAAQDSSLITRGLLLNSWLRKPIVAAVNGDCLGGGCEMLQSTDIRIAEAHARFGVPEVRRGLIAGAGSTMRLKRQIPYAVAMEMLLTGRILDAEEALRWGLVTHVVRTGASLAKAREIADILAANGPLSVAAAKASAIETGWLPEDQASPIELSYAARVMSSQDAKEGIRAFKEKRVPKFTGR